jgi:hypothetical protein
MMPVSIPHPAGRVRPGASSSPPKPLLRQMLDGAQSVCIEDPTVLEVHKHAVDGAHLHIAGFTMLADALDHDDQVLSKQASALIAQGNAEWQRWAAGVLTL